MIRDIRLNASLSVLMIAIVSLFACNKAVAPQAPVEESYAPAAGAVGLDTIPMGNGDGAMRWLVTYTDGSTTTKFQMSLNRANASSNGLLASGKGEFSSLPDSDPTPLLDALKKTLGAKRMPSNVQKAESLPFEFSQLGDNQSRTPDGAFHSDPKGNWTATKIFLANDQAEVYFNFNPTIHKAEFSIKNQEYGDRLLAEFAKVF